MSSPVQPGLAPVRGSVSRVLVFWAAYLAILFLVGVTKGFVPARFGPLLWGLASSAALLLLTRVSVARDSRSVAQVGLGVDSATPLRFCAGLTLGVAVYGLTLVTVSALAGPIQLVRAQAPETSAVLLTSLTMLALATMEELGFRGYPLWTLAASVGRWRAQLCVAVVFALSHLLYGWAWQTVLLGVLPSAVLFGAAALASGGLALPLGVHLGLNAARWAAGETETPGLWTLSVTEPLQGRVGSVAPVVGLALPLLVSAALWSWAARARARNAT